MSALDCPVCHQPMEELSIQPPGGTLVTLDTCTKCGGLWFDHAELELSSKRSLRRAHENEEVDYLCPRCDVHLWLQTLGEGHWASACIHCDGVFVDGEVVDHALALHPTAARAANAPHAGEGVERRRKRPKLKKEEPKDYLKDILVEKCVKCGDEAMNTVYVVGHGYVCRPCRNTLGLGAGPANRFVGQGVLFSFDLMKLFD